MLLPVENEFKELQAEWKTIGPVQRRKADALWNRFRAACDAFFAARAPHLEDALSELGDPIGISSVQSRLPKNTVLIEWVRYRPSPSEYTEHYAVGILYPDDTPVWLDLGQATEIRQHPGGMLRARVQIILPEELNAYDILVNDWIVFTSDTLPTAEAPRGQAVAAAAEAEPARLRQ